MEFRSDTFTLPTPEMRDAMFSAQVGDDVFQEDVSINALQEFSAQLFGFEAALFCPSGTMTNQIAINVHTRPGDEVICEEGSHVYFYEGGGIAKNSGCQVRLIAGDRGRITAQQILPCINPDDPHKARTRLVSLENTCNRGGGSCYDIQEVRKIKALCDAHGLSLHLDGARLMNALIFYSQSDGRPWQEHAKEWGSLFDSISVCLSKGLGAPVGSLLLGSREFVHQARRVRKVMGGGMRQAGFLAAAAQFALEDQVDRLQEDHQNAQLLEKTLLACNYVKSVMPVETNIVIFELHPEIDPTQFIQYMNQNGVKLSSMGGSKIRMVTHLNIQSSDIEGARHTLTQFQS